MLYTITTSSVALLLV